LRNWPDLREKNAIASASAAIGPSVENPASDRAALFALVAAAELNGDGRSVVVMRS
jgi:hypothetical protein